MGTAALFVLGYLGIVLALVLFKWANPPVTALQAERRVEALWKHRPYHKMQRSVPLASISPELQHAVVAAEDARFWRHNGFDWKEMETAARDDVENGRRRGASTIDQQLMKNLFFTSRGGLLRKVAEIMVVPAAERVLGKRRTLELYLNEIEWGPGVYGAEAAAQTWFHEPAAAVTRGQAIELAALLPAPLQRRPGRNGHYQAAIAARMSEMGW